jgi:hypothetical protein
LSEQTATTAEPAKAQPAKRLTFAELVLAIKDNFVLVSGAAVLIGVALSMTFLSSYLWIFDWHLIWFVQYTDIITFGLIAIGILSGSFAFLQSSTMTVMGALGMKGWTRTAWIVVIGVFAVALTAASVRDAIGRSEGYHHIIMGASAFLGAVFLIVIMARCVETASLPSSTQALFLVLALIGEVAIIGQWLGESVEETADFNQDVALKDQTLTNAKLVIVMSRHTVLSKDGVLYVVPTSDITRFRTVDKNAKPKFIPEE